jgi:hypothetical protein
MPSTQAKRTLEPAARDLVADPVDSNGVVAIFKLIDELTRRAAKILAQAKRFGALLEQTIARHPKRRFDAAAVAKVIVDMAKEWNAGDKRVAELRLGWPSTTRFAPTTPRSTPSPSSAISSPTWSWR